jgi:solute carrier family 39 (zinc transporter), member 1/2/3
MATCPSGNDYDGDFNLRLSAVFVIFFGSFFGAWFPVFVARRKGLDIRGYAAASFIAKVGLRFREWRPSADHKQYFGSGVIIATAFIHLLSPANDALRNPCLTGAITKYDWVEGICLIVIFVMFFIELMSQWPNSLLKGCRLIQFF